MARRTTRILAIVMTAALATLAVNAEASKPPKTWDGLVLEKRKGIDYFYVRPDTEFKAYKSVMLDPVEVAFDKNWNPNASQRDVSRHLSTADLQKIKDEMASEFRKVVAEELAKGGYSLVDQTGDDTLRVAAGLANVYINAPDTSQMTAGRSRTYVMESGQMTLIMELRDGPTGTLLARVVDTKVGNNTGFLQLSSSVTNSADFRRAVRDWAQRLVKGLDRVNGKTE